jgi:hypothetical protein
LNHSFIFFLLVIYLLFFSTQMFSFLEKNKTPISLKHGKVFIKTPKYLHFVTFFHHNVTIFFIWLKNRPLWYIFHSYFPHWSNAFKRGTKFDLFHSWNTPFLANKSLNEPAKTKTLETGLLQMCPFDCFENSCVTIQFPHYQFSIYGVQIP